MFGLTDEHSFGASIAYGSYDFKYDYTSQTDRTIKREGVSDLKIKYLGNFDVQSMTSIFSRKPSSGPLEKLRQIMILTNRTFSSGRVTPLLPLALLRSSDAVSFGARVGVSLPLDGDSEITSGGVTKSGTVSEGNTASVEYLWNLKTPFHPNFELEYGDVSTKKEKYDTASVTYKELKILSLSFTGRIEVTPGFGGVTAFGLPKLISIKTT